MRILDMSTPVGRLRITSDGTAISRIAWRAEAPGGAPGSGMLKSETVNPGADCIICQQAAAEIQAYFARDLTAFTVPLRLGGAPLQRAVWAAIGRIPHGSTLTYGAIAAEVGSAAQAVGLACGQNPVPLILPCHRVVGAGGALVGYSGGQGLQTKAFLLDLEAGQGRLI